MQHFGLQNYVGSKDHQVLDPQEALSLIVQGPKSIDSIGPTVYIKGVRPFEGSRPKTELTNRRNSGFLWRLAWI